MMTMCIDSYQKYFTLNHFVVCSYLQWYLMNNVICSCWIYQLLNICCILLNFINIHYFIIIIMKELNWIELTVYWIMQLIVPIDNNKESSNDDTCYIVLTTRLSMEQFLLLLISSFFINYSISCLNWKYQLIMQPWGSKKHRSSKKNSNWSYHETLSNWYLACSKELTRKIWHGL